MNWSSWAFLSDEIRLEPDDMVGRQQRNRGRRLVVPGGFEFDRLPK